MENWYKIEYINGECPAVASTRALEATMVTSITPLEGGKPVKIIDDADEVQDFTKSEDDMGAYGIHYFYEEDGKCLCKEQPALMFVFPEEWDPDTDETQVMYAVFEEPINADILAKISEGIVVIDVM